jgi:hypothetical protein
VAVLAGFALLGTGARLHAGHIPCATLDQLLGRSPDELSPLLGEVSLPGEPPAFPLPPEGGGVFPGPALGGWDFAPAGAGPRADSPTSSTPAPDSLAGLLAKRRHQPPRLVGILRLLRAPPGADPPPSSIFHPPRLS